MITFKAKNPIVNMFFILKTIFTCTKDVIRPTETQSLFAQGLQKNNDVLYYSVVKYTNDTELVQYCNFYLPLEDNAPLDNVNDLLDEFCGITHDFYQGYGKLNCCIIMKDLDFMHLQNAVSKEYGKTVNFIRISEDDSRL